MTWFGRFAGSGIYHVPGTTLIGVDINYVDDSAPNTIISGPHTFTFIHDKDPNAVAQEISSFGLAMKQSINTAISLASQFPVASTFIQIG